MNEISCLIYTPPHLPSEKKEGPGDWEGKFWREISVPAGNPNPFDQPVTNYRVTLFIGLVSAVPRATRCFGNQIHFSSWDDTVRVVPTQLGHTTEFQSNSLCWIQLTGWNVYIFSSGIKKWCVVFGPELLKIQNWRNLTCNISLPEPYRTNGSFWSLLIGNEFIQTLDWDAVHRHSIYKPERRIYSQLYLIHSDLSPNLQYSMQADSCESVDNI